MTYSVDWWVSRLENVHPVSGGYTARCPSHDDRHNSLKISYADSESSSVVHCYAGCSFTQILSSVLKRSGSQGRADPGVIRSKETDARAWWESYTRVPAVSWEDWGVYFDGPRVLFTWDEIPTVKARFAGTKDFIWAPAEGLAPPLWPSLSSPPPTRIYVSEGESDCGVARHLGLDCWSITKGAGSVRALEDVWIYLHKLGVREVVLISDHDEAGRKLRAEVRRQCLASRLRFGIVKIEELINPLLGEKDLKDIWRRVRDPEPMQALIEGTTQLDPWIDTHSRRYSAAELLERRLDQTRWIIDGLLPEKVISMIVGAPKIGKSWLTFDMALSVASGTPFLGEFKVSSPGAVVYITKEDPDYSVQDRLGKILVSKGLGGGMTRETGRVTVTLPPVDSLPFYLDLSRSFLFTSAHIDDLLVWLREIERLAGSIKLVIFDPILRMISDADEFKASEINAAIFEPATRVVQELGCSVLLVHHRSKGSSGKTSYGSVAFHAFSEATHYLEGNQPGEGGWVPVTSEFKSAEQKDWSFRFTDLADTYLVETGGPDEGSGTAEVGDPQETILAALRLGPKSVSDLIKDLNGLTHFQISQILKSLERKGVVKSEKGSASSSGGRRPNIWSIDND